MIGAEDAPYTYEYDFYYKILPAIHGWSASPARIKDGAKVPEGFVYSSDASPEWMTRDDLAAWIQENRDRIGAL